MVVNFQEVLIRVRKRVIAFRTSSKAWMITDNRSSSILPENLEQAARIISWYIYSSNWKYIAFVALLRYKQPAKLEPKVPRADINGSMMTRRTPPSGRTLTWALFRRNLPETRWGNKNRINFKTYQNFYFPLPPALHESNLFMFHSILSVLFIFRMRVAGPLHQDEDCTRKL